MFVEKPFALTEAQAKVILDAGTAAGRRVSVNYLYNFETPGLELEKLLAAGARRGAMKLGLPVEECRIVVIGDTPKDVAAAKDIGAYSIAVATGMHDLAELKACGPTAVFANLADADAEAVLFGR